ncbi:RNA polymerase subunit sigma [Paraburkholderia ginsengiterrae]|uniref:RNA polymerase subunit sigma n=1 Tax=Paraburkholderia ginsengiterrae TaxID=1462993 RepID=A0A1A9NER6_9BURK|nr:sigma-70 family RNA polymerase sigma factor [Paraburkholderia ginsengiterrae]OAJ63774.1 RNA polymerase subunit sigma [Paraburkholderia ginsengiterrae]OAJ65136.1 RNA polymerase subunit sigma [Paraburkholderia ginsengiterrae]
MSANPSTLHHEMQALYSDHHGWLHAWLRKKIGCTHRAADLAHDTFLRLLARDEPLVLHEPRAFLTTVAQRVMANHWRREQIERAYREALAHVPEQFAPSPEERALLLEALCEIDSLLERLPVAVKRAFLLAQLDGLSHADIAEQLKISIATVKRHLVRAGAQCFFALSVA